MDELKFLRLAKMAVNWAAVGDEWFFSNNPQMHEFYLEVERRLNLEQAKRQRKKESASPGEGEKPPKE